MTWSRELFSATGMIPEVSDGQSLSLSALHASRATNPFLKEYPDEISPCLPQSILCTSQFHFFTCDQNEHLVLFLMPYLVA